MPASSRNISLAFLALSAALASADNGAFFAPTGFLDPQHAQSGASSISRDGRTTLVNSQRYFTLSSGYLVTQRPALWTAQGGLLEVPVDASDLGNYSFYKMSGDGRTLVGDNGSGALRWTAGGGFEPLSLPQDAIHAHADGVSYDGAVVVGSYQVLTSTMFEMRGYRWEAGATVALETGGGYFGVMDLSADGSTTVGQLIGSSGYVPCRWDAQGHRTDLPMPQNASTAGAASVSRDGSVIVGFCAAYGSHNSAAYRWDSFGARALPSLSNLPGDYRARAVSDDGTVVVGKYFASGQSGNFIWDASHGTRDLRDALIAAGLGDQIQGWDLAYVIDVTVDPDGRTVVVGQGVDPAGNAQGFTAALPAAATFTALGDLDGGDLSSTATGLSVDGETVVGYGHNDYGKRAFVWTRERGMFDIGNVTGEAAGVAAGGATVVGTGSGGFRWRESGNGRWLGASAQARAITPDGAISVGSNVGSDGVRHAYRWTETGTQRYTTYMGGRVVPSAASAVTADGQTFVGSTLAHSYGGANVTARAVVWTANGGQRALGDLPGGAVESEALGVSADGGAIVGWSRSGNGPEAFLWTPVKGMIGLGDLPGSGFASRANAVSPDGRIVVGTGVAGGRNRAFLWDARYGMRDLQSLLIQNGATGFDGWTLYEATAVTTGADGTIFVSGTGLDASGGRQAFHATLPRFAVRPPQA